MMNAGKLKAKSIIFKVFVKEPLSRVKYEKHVEFNNVTLKEAISRLHYMFPCMIWEIREIYIDGYKIARLPFSNQYMRKARNGGLRE